MSKPLTSAGILFLRKKVYGYCDKHSRDFPWRRNLNPYRVVVSEIMLQQTQVERVIEKYQEFIATFPDFPALAKASLPKLLKIWSGMGYNRRALALKALAQKVVDEYRGILPSDSDKLVALPGIGKYTAGAVMAFAFNKPAVFLDTNIRRVYIHEFFHDRENIRDEELMPLIEQTLDCEHPRKWYNALMDYGAMLKKEFSNPNRKSAHYTRQSPFENSNRQVRGRILKILVAKSCLSAAEVVAQARMDRKRVMKNLSDLEREGFIRKQGENYLI